MRASLLLFCATTAVDALLVGVRPPLPIARGRPILLSSADDRPDIDNRDEETKAEDDALAAAFAARLEKEGGATQFKIKTTLTGAADELKGVTSGVASGAADGLADAKDALVGGSPVALLGGLLAAVVLFTLVSSAGRDNTQVDRYTSDGTSLEFGQRRDRESAYVPQYGVGTLPQ